jgi:DNA-binding winged helix-turn-helix (wHTH) protein/tetratricopeptide (TPR) repeat protein
MLLNSPGQPKVTKEKRNFYEISAKSRRRVMIVLPENQIYRFEGVEVDISRGCLRRGDAECYLRQKSFQVLVYLLERRERLVSKEELMQAVWKDTAVTDDALVQSIKEIRRTLGDSSRNSKFIKTVPKAGYRFISPVLEVFGGASAFVATEEVTSIELVYEETSDSPALDSQIPTTFPVALSKRRVNFRIVAAIIFLSTLGLSFYFIPRLLQTEHSVIALSPNSGKKTIAVMFFENQSKSAELDWLCEGLADMLITNLSRSDKLIVLSRQQLHTLLERAGYESGDGNNLEKVREVAGKSGAEVFVTGSFARLGEKVRLDVQMHNAETGGLVAAESLTAEKPEQILTDIDLLSFKLAKRFGAGDSRENRTNLADAMTDNLEAYRYYSLGVEKAQAMQIKEAVELLEKAVALDSQFAMAHARLGYVYSITSGEAEKGKPYLEKAFKLSDILTEKDRLNINAWYAIANLDFPAAIQIHREIIDKYPLETENYRQLGKLLAGEEQINEAIQVLKQGLAVDSENKYLHNNLGGLLSVLGRHDEAILAHTRYVSLAPTEPNAYDSLGLSYQWAGDYQSAIANFNRALELAPNFEVALIHLANTRVWVGQYKEAINLYRRYIQIALSDRERARGWNCIAQVYLKKRDLVSAGKAANETLKFRKDSAWQAFVVASERGDAARAGKLEKFLFSKVPFNERGVRQKLRFELYSRGYIALKKGQTDEAIRTFTEVIKRQAPPWNIEAFEDCLANAYLELGRFDEAVAEYERILRLNPNYPLARFYLAQAFERKGQPHQARDAYQSFLDTWRDADADIPELITAKKFTGEL